MATVGVYSAYTTDVVLVQRVYYNQEFNFICEWTVSFFVVSKILICIRPMAIDHVDDASRIFYMWNRTTLSYRSTFYE